MLIIQFDINHLFVQLNGFKYSKGLNFYLNDLYIYIYIYIYMQVNQKILSS